MSVAFTKGVCGTSDAIGRTEPRARLPLWGLNQDPGAGFEKVSGEAVSEGVNGDVLAECGLSVFAKQVEKPGREHDVAVLAALAQAEVVDHAFAVDVVGAE